MLYGSVSWVTDKRHDREIQAAEMRFLRISVRGCRRNGISEKLNICDIDSELRARETHMLTEWMTDKLHVGLHTSQSKDFPILPAISKFTTIFGLKYYFWLSVISNPHFAYSS